MAEASLKEVETKNTHNSGENLQAAMDSVQNKDDVNRLATQTLQDLNRMDGKSFKEMIGQAMVKESTNMAGVNLKGMDIEEIQLDNKGHVKSLSFSDPFSSDRVHNRSTITKDEVKPQDTKISALCHWANSRSGESGTDSFGGPSKPSVSKELLKATVCKQLDEGIRGHMNVFNTEYHKNWH